MKRAHKLAITVGTLVVLALFLYGIHQALETRKGRVFETYLYEAKNFKIKVEARHEEGLLVWLPGAYYDYLGNTKDSTTWTPIFTLLVDHPVEISKDRIKVVNDNTAYLFDWWMYAITTDGGKSWQTWDGYRTVSQHSGLAYGSIDKVNMDASGAGTMRTINQEGILSKLYTKDYGKTWYEQ
jgi:hypothetical protein